MEGAKELNSPVILQASGAARKYAGPIFKTELVHKNAKNKKSPIWEYCRPRRGDQRYVLTLRMDNQPIRYKADME